MKALLLSISLLVLGQSYAYNSQVDSLHQVLKLQSDPEQRANTLLEIGNQYLLYSNDTAAMYFDEAWKLAQRTTNDRLKSDVNYRRGLAYQYIDPAKSAEFTLLAVEYAEKTDDNRLVAYSRNMLGNVYRANGDYDKAMDEYQYALKISEKAFDSLQVARCYNNIGIIYMLKAEYDIGLDYWLKSLDMKLMLGEEEASAATMSNIALYYKDIGRYFEAKEYLERALDINLRVNDYESVSFCYTIIGDMYWRMNNPAMAVDNYKTALAYSDTIGSYYDKEESLIGLSRVLDSLGRYKEALDYHRQYTQLMLDWHNENNTRITREITTKFETEKQKKENALLKSENEAKDAKIELKEANNRYLWVGLGMTGLIIILVVFILVRVRQAKQEVELQKHIVEEKNKEITDSITYAQRLQQAILPTDQSITEELKESFVLFLPKDIVAGDFYWMEKQGDLIHFAVADCTGHGVPGAMVSVVCNNALNRAVREFGLQDPGKILDKVTDLVIETFEKSEEEVKDGMDIALCTFNFNTQKVQFAGANNGLYHMVNGKINEIKPTKQPVGKYANRLPFKTNEINFNTGDIFYLFTDGFADQFGGDKGKKLKYKPFKELLEKHARSSLSDQKSALQQTFENWMGDYEQVDDVCVAGIKV